MFGMKGLIGKICRVKIPGDYFARTASVYNLKLDTQSYTGTVYCLVYPLVHIHNRTKFCQGWFCYLGYGIHKSHHFNILMHSIRSDNDYAKWYKTTTWKLLQLLSGGDTRTLLNDVVKQLVHQNGNHVMHYSVKL